MIFYFLLYFYIGIVMVEFFTNVLNGSKYAHYEIDENSDPVPVGVDVSEYDDLVILNNWEAFAWTAMWPLVFVVILLVIIYFIFAGR